MAGYYAVLAVLLLFIVTPVAEVCNCSMFCCALLCIHFGVAVVLIGKRELVALLGLSPWCLVMAGWLFFGVPWGCLQFVIVVFPDHAHLLFFIFEMTITMSMGRTFSSSLKGPTQTQH